MADEKLKTMELWDSVCVTDPKTTKAVEIGQRHFTAICAQSQIKRATELWGPFGGAWGVKDEEFKVIPHQDIRAMLYKAHLYYPGGVIGIHSDDEIIIRQGKRKDYYNEDFSKKIATDALTKGLSKLGFNADVFEGKFDDNKYVAALKENGPKPVSETSKEDMEEQAFGKLGDLPDSDKAVLDDPEPFVKEIEEPASEKPQGRVITEKQGKRMYAIAMSNGWDKEDMKLVLKQYNFSSTKVVTAEKYEEIVAVFEAGPA